MTVLLDHCIPRRYRGLLQEWGYSAELLTAHLPADSLDEDVLALAQRLDAVLLTVDLDFAHILEYPPSKHAGIIVMRYSAEDEADLDETLHVAMNDLYREGLRGALVIISPTRYRLRR